MISAPVAFHVRWEGRVQGVASRATVQQACTSRRILGWVRNDSDGTVEATLVGDSNLIQATLETIGHLPPAQVRRTTITEVAIPSDLPECFTIRR